MISVDTRRPQPRKSTVNLQRETKSERRRLALIDDPLTAEEETLRPRTREDCAGGPRPCPWISCRYHLYLEVGRTGNLTFYYPHLEPSDIPETCALDVADRGPQSLDAVGRLYNITRERARQVEKIALEKLIENPIVFELV